MKGRLIREQSGEIFFLAPTGSKVPATDQLIYNLLRNFPKFHEKFWKEDETWRTSGYLDMAMYPGETLAFITDENHLLIIDPEPFMCLMDSKYVIDIDNYIPIIEYAKKFNKSREIVKVYCREGRIPGAKMINNNWMVPADAPYPIPLRRQREGTTGRMNGRGRPKKKKDPVSEQPGNPEKSSS